MFTWQGHDLEYLDHPYNTTRYNERAVEVPIARAWMDAHGPPFPGLEVGNVLAHYQEIFHTVVDLHEHAAGVINEDIRTYQQDPFRWIVCLSTLEHIEFGTDALAHLRDDLLAPGAPMLVTIPFGVSPPLDAMILAGETGATRDCAMVRAGAEWRQTSRFETRPYGVIPPGWAASVWIGEFGPIV